MESGSKQVFNFVFHLLDGIQQTNGKNDCLLELTSYFCIKLNWKLKEDYDVTLGVSANFSFQIERKKKLMSIIAF